MDGWVAWAGLGLGIVNSAVGVVRYLAERRRVTARLSFDSVATGAVGVELLARVRVSTAGRPCGVRDIDFPWLGPGPLPREGQHLQGRLLDPRETYWPDRLDNLGWPFSHGSEDVAAESERTWIYRIEPLKPRQRIRADVSLVGRSRLIRSNVVSMPPKD